MARPHGQHTSLAAFRPLLPAEEEIVAALGSGDFDRLGDGLRPEAGAPGREVRAGFLRFLILGGEDGCRPHEKGVRVSGGWITGVLDLEGCRIPRDIGLNDCLVEAVPILRSAIIDSLFLDGSSLPGLRAERLEARGSLTLRGAAVQGTVALGGARLGGNLECDGAVVTRPDGIALDVEALSARALLLRGARIAGGLAGNGARLKGDFDAAGATLSRAEGPALNAEDLQTDGNVVLRGARIEGECRLQGIRVEGDLDCSGARITPANGSALLLNRASVGGAFFLRGGAVQGLLDMTGATLGTIHDDEGSWPAKGDLLLNRCRYGAFIEGPVDARARLDWLARQSPERWGEDFWPQPYEQLASVFRDMGHDEDARTVLIAKERLQRRARRERARSPFRRALLSVTDAVLAVTVRYGRQPLLAFVWLVFFWAAGVAVFGFAEGAGAFKPNSPVVIRSPEWTLCGAPQSEQRFITASQSMQQGRARPGQTQLDCFREQTEAGSYPPFNAWMYSLDTLFPVLEIDQKEFWRPDPTKPFGGMAMNYFYVQSIVGWGLSLLAVAGFSGLVKSR